VSLFIKDRDEELIVADDFDSLLLEDLTNEIYPQEINLANINYWILFAQYALERFIKTPYSQNSFIDAFNVNPKLEYANKLFSQIYELVKGDEVRNNRNFSMARFYKHFTDFITYEGTSEFERKGIIQKMFEEMKVADISTVNPSIKVYVILSMISTKGFEIETLNVVDEIGNTKNTIPEIYFWCAEICEKLKDIDKLKYYISQYLKSIPTVQEKHIIHLIGVFEMLQRHKIEYETQIKLFESIMSFEQTPFKQLLFANIQCFDGELDEETSMILDNLVNDPIINSWQLKWPIVICYYRIGEAKKSKACFDTFLEQIELSTNVQFLNMYIRLLITAISDNWASEKDKQLFFKLSQIWRVNFPYQEEFNFAELNSASAIQNHKLAVEVAEYGVIHSVENEIYYKSQLIDALCFQNPKSKEVKEKIDALFTYELLETAFTEQQKLNIISHLFDNEKYQLAIEFFYAIVTENPSREDLEVKYVFNEFTLGNAWDEYFPDPITVEDSNYVRFNLNGTEQYKQINKDKTDPSLYDKLIDNSVGEYEKPNFDDGSKTILEILEINHKCIGLKNTIYNRINNGEQLVFGGFQKKQIKYTENGDLDIDDFHRQMQELSGATGTKRELFWNELLNKYRNNEAGFLDISRFLGCPFKTYDYITHSLYFPTLPICNHNLLEVGNDSKFVLDFTSLNLFADLYDKGIVDFKKINVQFRVTQSTYDYVESELKKAKNERVDSISISVTLERVRPIFSNEDNVSYNIRRIDKVFEWIKLYCEVEEFSEESLPFFLEMSKSEVLKKRDDLANIYIETMVLSMNKNTLVISDDSSFFKRVPNTISSEYFLAKFGLKSSESSERMLELNYRSLTIDSDNLYYLFNKNKFLSSHNNNFNKALNYSFSDWNPNEDNVRHTFKFLKQLYTDNLSTEYKNKVCINILSVLVQSAYIDNDRMKQKLVSFLDKEFNLLPIYQIAIMTVFNALVERMPR
jgi:hypothetical protein